MINLHLYPSPITNESRILRSARSIEKLSIFESIIIVGQLEKGLAKRENLDSSIQINRVDVSVAIHSPSIVRLGVWVLLVLWQYRNEDVSCVNCHSWVGLLVGLVFKFNQHSKIVYEPHELESECANASYLKSKLSFITERFSFPFIDASIFVSDSIETWYRQTFSVQNATTILNIPELEFNTENIHTDRFREARASIGEHSKLFLYQGLLSRGRGIEKLIEVFDNEKKANLVIMGYGPLEDYVVNAVESNQNIFFHPAVSPEKLLGYTKAADYGISYIEPVSLSYEYCMPNKLFEYLFADLPMLVSPTVEQAHFVNENAIGVVIQDYTTAAISSAVKNILELDQSKLKYNLALTRKKFTWKHQQTKFRFIYTSIGYEIPALN
jgi:glycosyltransferase involved in cell wall biosynthesis